MKQGIHPEYREVVFTDVSSDFSFVTRSTAPTRETIKWKDGKEYPLVKLDTSSESHPFYTGAQTRVVEAGRVVLPPRETRTSTAAAAGCGSHGGQEQASIRPAGDGHRFAGT